jgi:hypothetical protein
VIDFISDNPSMDENKTKRTERRTKRERGNYSKKVRQARRSGEDIPCEIINVFVSPQSVDMVNMKGTDAEKEQAVEELYKNGGR